MSEIEAATRPTYRPYPARVSAVRRLGDHFIRVTFTGDDFEHFGVVGPDQRIKVVLPHADGSFAEVGQDGRGEWYDLWRALPTPQRNPFRTYTVRRVDHAARELDVDFVVHGGPGPAGAWAEQASAGQELLLVGADLRADGPYGGTDWHPGEARRILLAGDETALPAIAAIIESLGEDASVDAFVEVPTASDVVAVAAPAGVRLSWLAREDRAHGAALTEAVTAWAESSTELLARAAAPRAQELEDVDVDVDLLWDSPEDVDGEFYAWLAGEAATIKGLRRLLVSTHGVDRGRVAFMGYWRLGQSERME